MPRGRDVLNDHVDVNPGLCQLAEQLGSNPRLVRNSMDGDLGLRRVMDDAGNDCLFHRLLLDPGTGGVVKRRPDMDGNPEAAGEFYRAVH